MPRTPTKPTLPPLSGTVDDCDFDEQSAVFARPGDRAPHTDPPASNVESTLRIDAMIEQARAVIAALKPSDLRARLLHIAIVRRDEVLLSGMLRSLRSGSGEHAAADARERTTILPPPDRKK